MGVSCSVAERIVDLAPRSCTIKPLRDALSGSVNSSYLDSLFRDLFSMAEQWERGNQDEYHHPRPLESSEVTSAYLPLRFLS